MCMLYVVVPAFGVPFLRSGEASMVELLRRTMMFTREQ